MPVSMGELKINGLRKIFDGDKGEIVAVDDLDITIEDGEFIVLVGPSGCGKSTTLRCVAGLESVTEGEILLDGVEITDEKSRYRDIAMVFQNYALYPHMTARENMSFGLKMSTDYSESEISNRVEKAAEMMGIEDLLNDTPKELSGGQQQRVALGRAIVRDPAAFLMDEPLSNLDAKLRSKMRTELQELQAELGVTTIYVTHDQTEAMTMGDRIAILDGGKLQQIGTPLECYHEPANEFVAGFIGSPSMNFIEMSVADGSLTHNSFDYHLSPETLEHVKNTANDLSLGIRPEDIEAADPTDENSINVTVKVIEPLGDSTLVYFDIGNTECTASLPGDVAVVEGDTLSIVFPEDKIHLFDADTGQAVKNRESADETKSEWAPHA